mmetsp:Transcript_7646/g.19287  ORF Transcript_7646/g.19287 Transcript_7646/m.19287 type:complete len:369 (-) Transcript_7646:485-1591(-)
MGEQTKFLVACEFTRLTLTHFLVEIRTCIMLMFGVSQNSSTFTNIFTRCALRTEVFLGSARSTKPLGPSHLHLENLDLVDHEVCCTSQEVPRVLSAVHKAFKEERVADVGVALIVGVAVICYVQIVASTVGRAVVGAVHNELLALRPGLVHLHGLVGWVGQREHKRVRVFRLALGAFPAQGRVPAKQVAALLALNDRDGRPHLVALAVEVCGTEAISRRLVAQHPPHFRVTVKAGQQLLLLIRQQLRAQEAVAQHLQVAAVVQSKVLDLDHELLHVGLVVRRHYGARLKVLQDGAEGLGGPVDKETPLLVLHGAMPAAEHGLKHAAVHLAQRCFIRRELLPAHIQLKDGLLDGELLRHLPFLFFKNMF